MFSIINSLKQYPLIKKTKGHFSSPSLVIKTPVSKWRRAYAWGDYHLAVLLKKELEKLGYFVLLQALPEWENGESEQYDAVIVLRGLSRYQVNPQQTNIMWNISHPDQVSLDEYEDYDHVFIASHYWANKIASQISTPVEAMLQCTDIQRFRPPDKKEKQASQHQLLFVGNARKVQRKILRDLMPSDYELAVYGKKWKPLLEKKYIKASHIPNNQLYKYYAACEILLNDHWGDMRNKGFVSNRIFDGLACGAFIVSDKVRDMGKLANFIETYETPEELKRKIDFFLKHPDKRKAMALKGMEYVRQHHTFEKRAKQFVKAIQAIKQEQVTKEKT